MKTADDYGGLSLKKLFIMGDGRLRPEWRLIVVLILELLITAMLFRVLWDLTMLSLKIPPGLAPDGRLEFLMETIAGDELLGLASQLIPSIALILAILLALRFIDRKSIEDIGAGFCARDRKELAFGLGLGALSMTVIFAVLLASKSITLENALAHPMLSWNLAIGIVVFIFVGLSEELYSRAYSISALSEIYNRWSAAIVSSVLFSLLHAGNANVSMGGLANVLLVGILFAYMFLRSGSVWMPVGYHITWNYFQGYVFGFPVSGAEVEGAYTVAASRNDFLTGGAFGPEGGLLATTAILAGFYIVWRFTGGGNPWRTREPEGDSEFL